MNSRILSGLAPAIIALTPCLAQQDQPGTDQIRSTRPADQRASMLIKGKNIVGATVVNKADEKLGKIDDLLVDSRNGYAIYGIISEGGLLGIGDKLIAVPWTAFDVLPNGDGDATVVLDTTKEQLKSAPNFDKARWTTICERNYMDRVHDYFGAEPSLSDAGTGGWGRDSTLMRNWDAGKNLDIKGTVTRVEHKTPARGIGEGETLAIKGEDGQDRIVSLGPSWFIGGQSASIKEGDEVEIHAHEAKVRDNDVIVACEVVMPSGSKMALRDHSGTPVWDSAVVRPGGAGAQACARCSELSGADVQGIGDNKKIADVKEVAIDPRTGRIPFLVLGSGGVLGMGEREVVVPWQALTCTRHDDKVAIAGDESTLKIAPQLGKGGFAMINDPSFRRQVNSTSGAGKVYATPEPTPPGMPAAHEGADAWCAGSDYNKLFTGNTETLTGTVQDMSAASPMPGMSAGAQCTVKTDEGTKVVQLGPTWFVSRQELRFAKGDEVTIKGVSANINGDQVFLPSEIKSSEGTLRLRDDQGRPAWDAIQKGSGAGQDKDKDKDKD
jgi:sporulation protein YlmC with PRC-barrel domain